MRRVVWAGIGVGIFGAVCASAGTIGVTADAQGFTKGIPFQVIVQITGKQVGSIDVPDIDGASIEKVPSYSGTQVNYTRGIVTATNSFGYTVTPQRAGEIIVPPFIAEIDGETIESKPVRITVLESPKSNDSAARSLAGDQTLFTQIKTDKQEAYQGEAIVLTMEVWILEGARVRYEPTGFPELTGFYALPREPGKAEERMETNEGRRYKIVPFVQILFPTSSGELRIGPWTWSCDIAYRGIARSRETKTDPFTISVKPLPPPPAGFSGSVGSFDVKSALSAYATDVGVPVTLTVAVSGNGNPHAIGTPELPEADGVYVDEPKRLDYAAQGAGPAGQNFVYKLTPQRAGDITIPPLRYVYFDPGQGAYQTAETDPAVLRVRASAKREDQIIVGAGDAETPGASLRPDILDIETKTGPLAPRGGLAVPTAFTYVTPVAAYAAFALFLRRQRRFATDRAFARAHRALRDGTERLAHARTSGRPADALYTAVTGYISDRFDLAEIGMTSAEAQLFFDAHAVPEDTSSAFNKILRTCERARYAAVELSADEVEALIQGALAGMQRLEEFPKRSGGI